MLTLQAALSEALQGRSLDRHLDADEAIVMGAGLFAANLSSSFRLRKFGMVDKAVFGVTFEASGIAAGHDSPAEPLDSSAGTDSEDAGSTPGVSTKSLLPVGKKLPIKRAIKYTNLTVDTFSFSLSYNTSSLHSLPPGTSQPLLGTWAVSGIADVVKRYNSSGVCALTFEADHGALLSIDKADCTIEQTVMEEKVVPVPDTNSTASNDTAAAGSSNSTNATTTTTILVPKKKLLKVGLGCTRRCYLLI
jgi:hypoxia up-regulated 1